AGFRRIEPRASEQAAFARLPADVRVVELGKRLVVERSCAGCHTIAPGGKALAVAAGIPSFADVRDGAQAAAGCLADHPARPGAAGGSVRLSREGPAGGAGPPAPAYAPRVTRQRFTCRACHGRDGEGGLTPALVDELRRYERAENSEAVTPPPLTGVARKLRTP